MSDADRNPEYVFGQFRLHSKRPELRKAGEKIQLTRKRHDILIFLVRNPGRPLSKEELIEAIWPMRNVEESNLSNQIYTLRRILEDDPANPTIIVTIPGIGYQFSEKVSVSTSSNAEECQQQLSIGSTAQPPWPDWPGWPRLWIITSVLGVLLVAITGGFWLYRQNRNQPISLPNAIPVTYYHGLESYPALSANGQFLAFTWDGDNLRNKDIYVKQIADGDPVRITSHPNEEIMATWSPDGKQIAFLRGSDRINEPYHLVIVPALGGIEREVSRVGGGLDWSPDGKYLAVVNPASTGNLSGIYLIPVDGGETRALTPHTAEDHIFDSTPRFSPDGRTVAFVRWKSDVSGDVHTVDLQSGEIRQVTFDRAAIGNASVQWINSGDDIIFISNRSGSFRLWQVARGGGTPMPVLNAAWQMDFYSIARDANLLVYAPKLEDSRIDVESNRSGSKGLNGRQKCVIDSTQMDQAPRLSPDGSNLLFTSNRTGWDEIWTARIDCTQSRQVTNFNAYGVGSPRWSPDGRRIVFDRRIDGRPEIFIIGSDGTGLRQLTNSKGSTRPFWSPDGESIYCTCDIPGTPNFEQICSLPVTGGQVSQVTSHGGVEPVLSTDGKWLYFKRDNFIFQKELPEGVESPVSGLEKIQIERYWDVSDTAIFYIPTSTTGKLGVYRLDLATRKSILVKDLSEMPIPWQLGLSISRDESQFAISLINQRLGDIMMVRGWR